MNDERPSRVLIVDYDENVLIALESLLEDEGIETTTTWSAQDALDLLRTDGFDLLLMGDRVADLSCEEFLREIQRQGSTASILVMESAGARGPSQAAYFESLGVGATVRKRELASVIEKVKTVTAHHLKKRARAA